MRKHSARSDTHITTIGLLCPYKMYRYWWKPNTQSTLWCSGWSLAIVTLYLHSSSHMASDSWMSASSAWRRQCDLRSRGWLPEDHKSGNRTHRLTAQIVESSVVCEKVSATPSPLTSNHQTPKIAIFLIIMWGAGMSQRLSKLCATSKRNRRQG